MGTVQALAVAVRRRHWVSNEKLAFIPKNAIKCEVRSAIFIDSKENVEILNCPVREEGFDRIPP